MKITDLQFSYPEELVAQEPLRPSRVMWVEQGHPREISISELIERIPTGDVLVLNDTRVLKRRLFVQELEILFLKSLTSHRWEVLFPSRKFSIGDEIILPEGVSAKLIQKGRPQVLELSSSVDEDYFSRNAELPLPPYIQKARAQRHTVAADEAWYQTKWARKPGSFAAPTASLHFSEEDLQRLQEKGVQILYVTLHVGLGTFLPVTAEDLDQHEMHEEFAEISSEIWGKILEAKKNGRKIWALGTTVTRVLESRALGLIGESGFTKLLIQPGFRFQIVNQLMTNFHQPESTLLALVAAFSGLPTVRHCYQWAIERKFRLFSYGDLSVWSSPTAEPS